MGQRGYFAVLKINTLMAPQFSDRAQILNIQTLHDLLLYMKDKNSGGSCQTNNMNPPNGPKMVLNRLTNMRKNKKTFS